MKRKVVRPTNRAVLESLVHTGVAMGYLKGQNKIEALIKRKLLTPKNIKLILAHIDEVERQMKSRVGDAMEKAFHRLLEFYGEDIAGPLARVFKDETIEIPATDGTRTFADAFPWKTSASSFLNRRRKSKPTPKTKVAIYDIFSDGWDFREIYDRAFRRQNLRDLCLTEAQIAMFCRNRKKYLNKGKNSMYSTNFFYREADGRIGVATVQFDDHSYQMEERGWSIGWIDLESEHASEGERFVIPVLKS